MPNFGFAKNVGKGLLGWGKGKGAGLRDWYGGLGSTAQHSILGAGVGALTGAFGMNPLNMIPFVGDVDAGGALGGAIGGALAGAAFGRFGANRNLLGKGKAKLQSGLMGMTLHPNGVLKTNSRLAKTAGWLHEQVARPGLHRLVTNQSGDRVLAGLAAASAGLIGGSILSTNSPY